MPYLVGTSPPGSRPKAARFTPRGGYVRAQLSPQYVAVTRLTIRTSADWLRETTMQCLLQIRFTPAVRPKRNARLALPAAGEAYTMHSSSLSEGIDAFVAWCRKRGIKAKRSTTRTGNRRVPCVVAGRMAGYIVQSRPSRI